MTKHKFLIGIIILLAISNIILISSKFIRKVPHHDRPRNVVIEKLQLDDDQIILYDELIKVHRSTIHKKDDEIVLLKNELYATMGNNQSEDSSDQIIGKIGALQMEIEMAHYTHFRDIKKICMPDQLKAYKELVLEIEKIFRRPKKPKK